MRRVHHKALLLLAAAPALVSWTYIQGPKHEAQDEPLKLSTQLVVVDAQVISKKTGAPVNGLTEHDFALYEEGVKQQITHFSKDTLPLSIVLLLDVSGSVTAAIREVRDSGLRALNELKPGDEIAVMAFGAWATVLQDFTQDRQLLASQIAAIDSIGPWIREGTYIDEAVYEAAFYLAKASKPDSRRIIVIVTDNFSNQEPGQGHSEAEALKQLHAAGAVVCGLVVGDFNGAAEGYRKRGFILRDSVAGYLAETGGIRAQVEDDDVTAKLAGLIEHLRTRYSLGYTPLNAKRDGRFRNITLKLSPDIERREGEVRIVARKGYYAPRSDSRSS